MLNTTKQSQKHCIYEAVVFQMFCIFGVFEPRFCRGFRISSCPNAARLQNAQSPRSKARKPWQVQELPKIRQILASLRPWLSNLGFVGWFWVFLSLPGFWQTDLGIFQPAEVFCASRLPKCCQAQKHPKYGKCPISRISGSCSDLGYFGVTSGFGNLGIK